MRNKIIFNLNWKKLLFSFYWLVVLLIIVDQASKALFLHLEATQGPGFELTIIDNFFYFSYTRNTGAAWSILRDYPIFLVLISLLPAGRCLPTVLLNAKSYHLYIKLRGHLPSPEPSATLLIVPSINFLRAVRVLLISYILDLAITIFRFFNVADMCLVIGLFGLIIMGFIDDNKPKIKTRSRESRRPPP